MGTHRAGEVTEVMTGIGSEARVVHGAHLRPATHRRTAHRTLENGHSEDTGYTTGNSKHSDSGFPPPWPCNSHPRARC